MKGFVFLCALITVYDVLLEVLPHLVFSAFELKTSFKNQAYTAR